MKFSRFSVFSAIQARQSEKIRSRCAVFRQFPSFHTVWTQIGRSLYPTTMVGHGPQSRSQLSHTSFKHLRLI